MGQLFNVLIVSVFSENVSGVGALLVGLGAITSSLLSLRSAKKRAQDECEQRIEDIREAFQAGIKYEPRKPRRNVS